MGEIQTKASQVYRDFNTDGVQASGKYAPSKAELRSLFATVDLAVYAAQAGIAIVADTAARDTYFATAANQSKLVYVNNNNDADDDPANGVYEYVDGAPRIATGYYQGLASVVQPLVDDAETAAAEAAATADGLSNAVELFPDPFFALSGGDEEFRVAGLRLYPETLANRTWAPGFVRAGVRGAWLVEGDQSVGSWSIPLTGAANDLAGVPVGGEMKVAYLHAAPPGTGVAIGARFVDKDGATIGDAQYGTASATASGNVSAITSGTLTRPSGAVEVRVFAYSTSDGPAIPVLNVNGGKASALPHLIARSFSSMQQGIGRKVSAAGLALSMQRTLVDQSALSVTNAASALAFIVRGDPDYRGWGEISDTPASIAVNAVRFARFKPVAPEPPIAKLRFVWRTAATAVDVRAPTADVVAIAEALVDPEKGEHGGAIALLRDPETFAPITVTQAMLDAKCGLMMQGLDAKGDPVPMEEIYGSTTGFANPAKHYVNAAEGDALTGEWGAVGASRGLGFEFLALTNATETIETVTAVEAAREAALLARHGPINTTAMATLRARLAAGTSLNYADIGDSQTDLGWRMLGGQRAELAAANLISNGGYCSASTEVYVPSDDVMPTWYINRSKSGTWTERGITTGGVGPDGTSSHSDEVGAWKEFACSHPVDGWIVLYQTMPGGGEFTCLLDGVAVDVPIGGTEYAAVDTDAAEAIAATQLITVEEPVDGNRTLRVSVSSAGSSGVELCGAAAIDLTEGKITIFKFGHSGARADHFAALDETKFKAGISAFSIDCCQVEFGANDQAAKIVPRTVFADAYGTVVSRLQDVVDDVALIGTSPTPETTVADIEDYTDEVFRIAQARGLPFVPLQPAFHSTARGVAEGTIQGDDLLHRTPLGGRVGAKVIVGTLFGL